MTYVVTARALIDKGYHIESEYDNLQDAARRYADLYSDKGIVDVEIEEVEDT